MNPRRLPTGRAAAYGSFDADRPLVERDLTRRGLTISGNGHRNKGGGNSPEEIELFTFAEGEGDSVRDSSGAGSGVELRIKDARNVRWLEGPGGVEFTGPGTIVGRGTGALFDRLRRTNRLTIEAWIQPGDLSQGGPARIVSMSADPGQRDFTLGQDKSGLAFRLRTTKTGANGTPQLDTAKGVLKKETMHVVCTFDGKTKYVYVNGRRRREEQRLGGDFSGWQRYPLIVGNEATGDRPWRGKVFLVALYDRALDQDEVQRNYRAGAGAARVDVKPAPRLPARANGPKSGSPASKVTKLPARPRQPKARATRPKPVRNRPAGDEPVPFTGDEPEPFTGRTRTSARGAVGSTSWSARRGDEPVPFTGD